MIAIEGNTGNKEGNTGNKLSFKHFLEIILIGVLTGNEMA